MLCEYKHACIEALEASSGSVIEEAFVLTKGETCEAVRTGRYKMDEMTTVIIALIALVGSIVATLMNYVSNRKNQQLSKELEKSKYSMAFIKQSFDILYNSISEIGNLSISTKSENVLEDMMDRNKKAKTLFLKLRPFMRKSIASILSKSLNDVEKINSKIQAEFIKEGIYTNNNKTDDVLKRIETMRGIDAKKKLIDSLEGLVREFLHKSNKFSHEFKENVNEEILYCSCILRGEQYEETCT